MKLLIGDTIQKLRKIKGLTQEQVANALGITTAAVSKWETNNTYPDISLLSPLARLLETSVDNLLNFKEKLSEEEINSFLQKANNFFEEADISKAMEYCSRLLHEYPNDDMLKFQIASTYMNYMGMSFDERLLNTQYSECIRLFEECLLSKNNEIRTATLHILSNLYMMNNELDKAENMANQLPILEFDARMLQADILYQKGLFDKSIELEQTCLFQEVQDASINLYSLAKNAYKKSEKTKALKILDILFLLESVMYVNEFLGINTSAFLFKLEILSSMGRINEAIHELNQLIEKLAEKVIPDSSEKWILYDRLQLNSDISPKKQTAENLKMLLENSNDIDLLKEHECYKIIFEKLTAYIES